MHKLPYDPSRIRQNTFLAMSVHIATLPSFSADDFSFCWERDNFCFQDHANTHGAFVFNPASGTLVGALRNDASERMRDYPGFDARSLFAQANSNIRAAADEALGYLKLSYPELKKHFFQKPRQIVVPVATTGFWTTGDAVFSCDTLDDFLAHGGALVDLLSAPVQQVREFLMEDYEPSDEEMAFADELLKIKMSGGNTIDETWVQSILPDKDAGCERLLAALTDFGIQVK